MKLNVKPIIKPIRYDTFQEAVDLTEMDDLSKLNRSRISSFEYTGKKIVLGLSEESYLVVSIGDNRIIWSVDTTPFNGCSIESQKLEFLFPQGEVFEWSWQECRDKLIGRKVIFQPGEQYLFFSTDDNVQYMVNVVGDVHLPEQKYLYLSEI